MTPERWRRIQQIFDAAIECDPAGRDAILARTAAEDQTLASDVRSLLDSHARTGTFLESPAWTVAPELLQPSPEIPRDQIGPYRVLEEIGRGGMGIVYAAEDTRLTHRRAQGAADRIRPRSRPARTART